MGGSRGLNRSRACESERSAVVFWPTVIRYCGLVRHCDPGHELSIPPAVAFAHSPATRRSVCVTTGRRQMCTLLNVRTRLSNGIQNEPSAGGLPPSCAATFGDAAHSPLAAAHGPLHSGAAGPLSPSSFDHGLARRTSCRLSTSRISTIGYTRWSTRSELITGWSPAAAYFERYAAPRRWPPSRSPLSRRHIAPDATSSAALTNCCFSVWSAPSRPSRR